MPPTLTIKRTRGDTYRIRMTFTESSGTAVDFTNAAAVTLTVNQEARPDDTTYELFSIVGDVVDPPTDGIVDFEITATEADYVGAFWYDIEVEDLTGKKRTLLEGPYIISQDITKSDEEFEWTPDSSIADDTIYDPFDSSAAFYLLNDADLSTSFTYQTRDTRKVIRDSYVPDASYDSTGWLVKGPELPRHVFEIPGWEWKITGYSNLSLFDLEVQDGLYYMGWWAALDTRSGSPDVSATGGTLYDSTLGYLQYDGSPTLPSTVGWQTSGWFTIGLRLNEDGTVSYMIKPETDPDNWITTAADFIFNPGVSPVHAPNLWTRRKYPNDAASVFDLWKYEWRRL